MEIYTVEYSNLETWLTEQNSNTRETAYIVRITEIPEDFVSTISTKLLTREDVFLDLSNTELPSVTDMTNCFLNCKTLTKAPVIPNSVTNMSYCFYNCTSLTKASVIGNSVTNMTYCFYNCYLTETPVIPDGVTDMTKCFYNCYKLTEAPVIPNSVTNMRYCFESCTSLTTAPVIPNSVTNMGSCFSDCTSLTTVPVIPDSVTNMTYCFSNCYSLIEAPVIGNSVTGMGYCFHDCTSLTEAPVIPNSVISMGNCFESCTSLTTAPVIPNSVTNMGSCFRNCTSLTEAPVIPDSVTNMSYCFYNCYKLTEAPVIPNSVTFMHNCFYNCTSLTEAPVIPNSRISMGSCFERCTSLTTAPVIPDGVTDMGYCFRDCTSLTTVPVIPNSVTKINNCFNNCSSLESINDWRLTDLSNVNTTGVFTGCTSLKNIYINKNIQQLEKYSLCQVNVKDSEVEYSFIDSDFTNEVTGVIEDVVSTLHIDGLIDEFIIGQSGSVTWELAKKALESKTQFSNLDKDFSPDDPHMVIWAKDKSKVKTNIIENALAGEIINDNKSSDKTTWSSNYLSFKLSPHKEDLIPAGTTIDTGWSLNQTESHFYGRLLQLDGHSGYGNDTYSYLLLVKANYNNATTVYCQQIGGLYLAATKSYTTHFQLGVSSEGTLTIKNKNAVVGSYRFI